LNWSPVAEVFVIVTPALFHVHENPSAPLGLVTLQTGATV
jgi:hypothetical protein